MAANWRTWRFFLAVGGWAVLWLGPAGPLFSQNPINQSSINRDARQEARQRIVEMAGNLGDGGTASGTPGAGFRGPDLGVWFAPGAAQGLVIADVSADGEFAQAGFRASDRILSINGQPVRGEAQFVQRLTSPSLADQLSTIVIERNGERRSLSLKPSLSRAAGLDELHQAGLLLDSRNPSQMVVERVLPGTAAFAAGLQAGDTITTLNGQPVTAEAFTQALQSGQPLGLTVNRSGQAQALTLAGVTSNSGGTTINATGAAAVSGGRAVSLGEPFTRRTGGPASAVPPSTVASPGTGQSTGVPFSLNALNGASRFSARAPSNPLLPGTAGANVAGSAGASASDGTSVPFSPGALNGASRFSPLVPNPPTGNFGAAQSTPTNPVVAGVNTANAIIQTQTGTAGAAGTGAAANTGSQTGNGIFGSKPANPGSSAGSLGQSAGGFSAAGGAGGAVNPVPGARTGNSGGRPRGGGPAAAGNGAAGAGAGAGAAGGAGAAAGGT